MVTFLIPFCTNHQKWFGTCLVLFSSSWWCWSSSSLVSLCHPHLAWQCLLCQSWHHWPIQFIFHGTSLLPPTSLVNTQCSSWHQPDWLWLRCKCWIWSTHTGYGLSGQSLFSSSYSVAGSWLQKYCCHNRLIEYSKLKRRDLLFCRSCLLFWIRV